MAASMDLVFKALADPHRRLLLDSLRQRDGQTLGQLCMQLDMARQSATQHLALLEAANLISTVWRGREKLHFLNPVPIYEIQQRWIDNFEVPRLRTIRGIKQRAEENDVSNRTFVYVTYIRATPEKVWHALTDADLTGEYWGHRNVSDWQVGSSWEHQRTDGSGIADVVGTVLETVPPRRLVITFEAPRESRVDERSNVTFTIEPYHDIVRLTVTHEYIPADGFEAAAAGWPAVFANLKSLLETGQVLPQAPWKMHADVRAAQMARKDSR